MVLSLEKITVLCWNAGFPRLKERAGATVHAVAGGLAALNFYQLITKRFYPMFSVRL